MSLTSSMSKSQGQMYSAAKLNQIYWPKIIVNRRTESKLPKPHDSPEQGVKLRQDPLT